MFLEAAPNKVHFTSLGCPRNLVDSEVMLGLLLKAGYEVTDQLSDADFLVVNTCGFLQESRQESCDTIDELFKHRKKGAKVIVAGCMVQKHKGELEEKFPSVHYFLGSGDVEGILNAVAAESPGQEVTRAKSYLESGEVPRQISTGKSFAYLKIAEGCRKACAYCIIPKIKGPLKSKSLERVTKEFNLLLDQGVKEVILIAQDLGDWGKDFKGEGEKETLTALLKELLKSDREFWIRLLYLYPDEISDELIDVMKNDKRVLPYLDMPIQHINNDMLQKMKRHTSREDIISILGKLRKEIPEIVIRTSLIVGFPSETEEQFQELAKFLQDHPIDNVGIFRYSKEEDSVAGKMPDQIPDDIKERRYKKLMKIQQKVSEKRLRSFVGKKLVAIVDGYHPETQLLLSARHYGFCPDIDGRIIINDARKLGAFGDFHEVEITDIAGYDLVGRIVKPMPKKEVKKKEVNCGHSHDHHHDHDHSHAKKPSKGLKLV